MNSNQLDVLSSLDRKLSILINLFAYQIVGQMTVTEGAPVLKRLGLNPSEIASVFQSTAKTVRVRLSEAKRKPAKQRDR